MMVLVPRNGAPPPPWFLLSVPVVFLAVSWLTNRMLGLPALYAAFPADPTDPIEQNLGWQQVEFGALRRQMTRFKGRFRSVEDDARAAGGWEHRTLDEMEAAWQAAKRKGKP